MATQTDDILQWKGYLKLAIHILCHKNRSPARMIKLNVDKIKKFYIVDFTRKTSVLGRSTDVATPTHLARNLLKQLKQMIILLLQKSAFNEHILHVEEENFG